VLSDILPPIDPYVHCRSCHTSHKADPAEWIEFLIMEEIRFEKLLPRSIEVITTNLIVTLIYSFL
jgi:hypothetical protein